MRESDGPFITRPVLQSRQGVRYFVVGIQVSDQGAGVGHRNHNQNVPGRLEQWASIHMNVSERNNHVSRKIHE